MADKLRRLLEAIRVIAADAIHLDDGGVLITEDQLAALCEAWEEVEEVEDAEAA